MATKTQSKKKTPGVIIPENLRQVSDGGSRNLLVLVMADPGVGKSTFLASVFGHIDPADCLFIELESNAFRAPEKRTECVDYLKAHGCPPPFPRDRVVVCKNLPLFDNFMQEHVFKPAARDGGVAPVRYIAIDSATQISDRLVAQYAPQEQPVGEAYKAWASIKAYWTTLLTRLEDLDDCVIAMSVHMQDMEQKSVQKGLKKNELTEMEKATMASIAGGAREFAHRKFHWVLHLERSGVGAASKFNVWTDKHDGVLAKCRDDFDLCEKNVTLGEMVSRAGYLAYYKK